MVPDPTPLPGAPHEAWQPLVSAVITTYRRPVPVRRAIASACAQTYRPLEIIVVEDGSESDLESWLAARNDGRVRYLRHDRNRGLAAARNTGLAAASGEYVAYLDDDDEWLPERIARQIDLLRALPAEQRAAWPVVCCAVAVHDHRGNLVRVSQPFNEGDLRASIVARRALRTLPSSGLFRTGTLRALGGFDETLPSSIDHDLWMALAAHGARALALREPLVVSRLPAAGGQMTTDTPRRIAGVRAFVDKWQPTWQEWLGDGDGERFAHRYFAHVVGRLVWHHARQGRLGKALGCLWAILGFKRRPWRNLRGLAEFALDRTAAAARRRAGHPTPERP